MTEEQWQSCGEPEAMLSFLRNRVSNRKLRLFAVACCRGIWPLLIDERSRQAVEIAELFAEGRATRSERVAARSAGLTAVETSWQGAPANDPDAFPSWQTRASIRATAASAAQWSAARSAYDAACSSARKAWYVKAADAVAENAPVDTYALWIQSEREERTRQVNIIHDLFGDPFHRIALEPGTPNWRTDELRELARTIAAEQSYDRLPLIAKKLGEARCSEFQLMEHCRRAAGHVRGCWAIDLLLGKE